MTTIGRLESPREPASAVARLQFRWRWRNCAEDDFLKKAHDFRDAEAQCAVAKQSRIKLVQVSRALKENIGGALALGGYPVVGHVLQKIGHQRIDLLGITVEKSRPIQRTKAV